MQIRDNRAKEWFWLDNEYLNGYAKYLGAPCTVVYLSLCRHADNNTQTCYPSMKLIAEENGISTKTVERATKKLEQWSIITIERTKKKDGTQANNVYTLTAKKYWKKKPTDLKSHGTDRQKEIEPTDKSDDNRQTVVLHNYTHINNTQLTKLNSNFSLLEDLIKTTMSYIDYDTGEIKEDAVKKQRLTGTENKELIAIGCLWVNMVKNETALEDQEIPVRGLINYIRNIYLKEKWDYKDFKQFFEYYMEKSKPEDKPNFGFCMNSQFVTKYKLAKKNRRYPTVSMSDEIII